MAQQEGTDSDMLREIRNNFVGTWQCNDVDNFEAVLKEMGIPYLMRKVAIRMKPDCEISIVDGKVRITMISTMKTEQEDLNFEEEVERDKLAGKVKIRSVFEDGKIIQFITPADPEKKKAKCTRQIEGENMLMIWEVGTAKATRTFSRKQ